MFKQMVYKQKLFGGAKTLASGLNQPKAISPCLTRMFSAKTGQIEFSDIVCKARKISGIY